MLIIEYFFYEFRGVHSDLLMSEIHLKIGIPNISGFSQGNLVRAKKKYINLKIARARNSLFVRFLQSLYKEAAEDSPANLLRGG